MKHAFYFVMIAALCTIFGCGGGGMKPIKTEYIEGKVTYKGQPVAIASLVFSPVKEGEGHPAYGITDSSGTYRIQTSLGAPGRGTTPGEYIVRISKTEGVPTGQFSTDPEGNRLAMVNTRHVLPVIYDSAATSPLRATVTQGGPNKFDFDLVDKP